MTKVITIPEFQIDDVVWTNTNLFAYYSSPGATEAGEHQFIKISLETFNQYLEDNAHLIIEVPSPYLTEQEYDNDPQPCYITPEEFRLLDNSHTWPIIKRHLEAFYRPIPELDGTAAAITSILSHFNPAQ